jgi:hypothetical protein
MNDVDPSAATADPPRLNKQPRRRPAARLAGPPSLVLAALAAAPLTAAIRIASHFGDPQTAAVLAEDCRNAFASGALHTLKWPDCAGD